MSFGDYLREAVMTSIKLEIIWATSSDSLMGFLKLFLKFFFKDVRDD